MPIHHARLLPVLLALSSLVLISEARLLAGPPRAPSHLTVDDDVNPIGVGPRPSFGWRVHDADPNELQTTYQIRVASTAQLLASGRADVWDSGEVRSRQQSHVDYRGPQLGADRQYFWQVRTWDKSGVRGPFSAPSHFVVGPLDNADWAGAQWIRRASTDVDDYTYYRKSVRLPAKPVQRATVYVTSVHKYELFINGQPVGKGPAYQYPQFQYYNGFDITARVRPGANLFALFNHWFGGGQGRATSARGVLMKAVIHYADGSIVTVNTDGSWKQLQAPSWVLGQLGRNPGEGIGYVERIDARKLLPLWNQPSFDDTAWAPVESIGPQPVAPWVNPPQPDLTRIVEEEIRPASVTPIGDGAYMVDLGKVYAGTPRITFSGGTPGQLVTMLGGYTLGANGRIDPTKNQAADLSYFAELNGSTFVYAPTEYVGLRFFQIEHAPMPIAASNFKFVVRHSRMDSTRSSFDSPNETLNAVWNLMKRSLTVGAQEEFVDTPTREKGGFLGDGAIMSTMAMPVYGERLLSERQLHEFIRSMEQFWPSEADRGRINAVYPNNDNARDIPDYTQAFLLWVWSYYMETGDRRFLEDQYDRLKDVAEYVYRARNAATGLITDIPGGSGGYVHGIIDWPASMRYGYDMTTAARTVVNGWAYADFDVMSRIAEVTNRPADRELYRQRAEALKTAINAKLLNADGVYVDGLRADGTPSTHVSQHANMFPLALGLVPETNRASVITKVKDLRMSVGMVTVLYLIRALGESHQGEHLIDLLTNATWDAGWARSLARGATATWESWTADVDGNSQSHAWGTGGLEAYVRYILGIQPTKPGYEEVQIRPLDFGTVLPWAKGSITTERGEIAVAWNRSASQYKATLTLPANVTASVCLPSGADTATTVRVDNRDVRGTLDSTCVRVTVGSGTHILTRAVAAR
ncbi:MAG: family 78 glycoside hydrolase catalytic domain [Vicinamibacterales bacterium]